MGWRVVVISNTVKLDYEMGYLCIRSKDDIKRVYIDEIAVLMIETVSVSLTSYLLIELSERKVNVIFCDRKGIPNGVYTALYGSYDTSKSIRKQVLWTDVNKELIWKLIVERKIYGQSKVLLFNEKYEESNKLLSYISQVEIGDSTNREGHAAKVYFNALFGKSFTREDKELLVNIGLNYGYAILLSAVSREIVSNGYLTQIGIFHDNIFNELNLACDLMEPFRPFVDQHIISLKLEKFEQEEKMKIVQFLNKKVRIDGREQYLLNSITIYVRSMLDAIDQANPLIVKYPEYELSIYESDSVL